MIFSVLFASGLEPASGAGLTFIALPNVFNQIAGGRILGTLFYIGFYITAAYPKSNDEVYKDLQEMIEKGFFPDVTLA